MCVILALGNAASQSNRCNMTDKTMMTRPTYDQQTTRSAVNHAHIAVYIEDPSIQSAHALVLYLGVGFGTGISFGNQNRRRVSLMSINTTKIDDCCSPAVVLSSRVFHSKLKALLFHKSYTDSSSSPYLTHRFNSTHHPSRLTATLPA